MRIKVKVVPKSSRERVEEAGGYLKVFLRDPPQKGKANRRLVEVLAEYFQVKKYLVRIVRGEYSREKIVEVDETK